MTKNQLLILVFIFPILIYSQNDFCSKSFGESYFPLKIGFQKEITWYTTVYKESISEKIEINGKEYFKYRQDFGNGNAPELILRKSNDTIYSYHKNKESIFLLTTPKVGVKWKGGKIISINGEFETSYCNYQNLLVVEHKYTNGEKGIRYYKKGLGLVGIKTKNKIIGACLPNKDEIKAMFRFATFKGCEGDLNNEKMNLCTRNAINKIVADRLKQGGFKTPKENGILQFKVYVSKTGQVDNITGLNSIKGGKQLKNVIIETLEKLPKFNPARTSETKTVGTNLELSIPINIK